MALLSRLRNPTKDAAERGSFQERQALIYLRAAELAYQESSQFADARHMVRARKEVEEALDREYKRNVIAVWLIAAMASGLGLLVVFGGVS